MKVACFIPIKEKSTRVPKKNFRTLNNRMLFEYIINAAINSKSFDNVYVDTDSDVVKRYCEKLSVKIIDRDPALAKDTANGNDLINRWCKDHPEYDIYFQLFATAPVLNLTTIKKCVNILLKEEKYDSVFTALEHCGWYWYKDKAINYDPRILPRSQDAKKVFSETTGLYGIRKNTLEELNCRIGNKPYIHFINEVEAVDIDSEFDFEIANFIAEKYDVKF